MPVTRHRKHFLFEAGTDIASPSALWESRSTTPRSNSSLDRGPSSSAKQDPLVSRLNPPSSHPELRVRVRISLLMVMDGYMIDDIRVLREGLREANHSYHLPSLSVPSKVTNFTVLSNNATRNASVSFDRPESFQGHQRSYLLTLYGRRFVCV